jgi:UDP-N-acetylglucosamine acyltransferase
MIHATAVIHPRAQVDPSAQIGPYAVIDEHVALGAHCRLGPYVYLTGVTVIGAYNVFHAGCVIGDAPQDLKYKDTPTRLRIGEHNIFREHFTAHRANTTEEDTVIGSHNFLMAHSHVAHNCQLGDHIVIANGALLAGHVTVQNRVFISGNCVVHQFCRLGPLSLMQGGSAISKDLPPFTIARRGSNALGGLNSVGLRRAGMAASERLELRRLYHALFAGELNLGDALAHARASFRGEAARTFLEFVEESKRGICTPQGADDDAPLAAREPE